METISIIGIITTKRQWIFIRYTCQARSRWLEISKTIECKLTWNNVKDDINVIISYVMWLLKALFEELEQWKSKYSRMG